MSTIPGEKEWWKEAVIYQIYPRSFKDSNGDGIGDLQGIISKIDYIRDLGVDLIWLNPVYASPNDDNGYDISDYTAIMHEFGDMHDFDTLLGLLHENGIRLMMDLVVNHSSDEHPWFKASRSARDNPYREYYHWWPVEKGMPPRRFSFFDPEGNAWQYDDATNAYYLHYFSKKQPDLNWENPALRKEIYRMMRFWLDKGVDGFRMDAISYISKDVKFPRITFRELKEKYRGSWNYYYTKGPHLHEYLQEMNREVLSGYDVVTLAEASGIPREEALYFVQAGRKEVNMLYHFEGMRLGYAASGFKRPLQRGYRLEAFKKVYSLWDKVFEKDGWGTIYLGNHDQPRMVSRWGNDLPAFREASAKMLITFLLTMRGTPIFYNGDELGMANIRFSHIEDYRDIETLSMYSLIKKRGGDTARFLKDQQIGARDNARTPFQWDATPGAGFTTGSPWIRVNSDHVTVNAVAEESEETSVLHYFRRMVHFRKMHKVLVYGDYEVYDEPHPRIYTYVRSNTEEKLVVILSFSTRSLRYKLPEGIEVQGKPLVNNYPDLRMHGRRLLLRPYQALIFFLAGGDPVQVASLAREEPTPSENKDASVAEEDVSVLQQ